MRCRQRDADRSLGKPRNATSSSTTYALAPVYCADSQLTSATTTDTSAGLTVVPQSPSKALTLPPRVGSPSPRTYRRGLQVRYSPATIARHKFVVDGDTMTPRFDDLDVWRIAAAAHDRADDLSVLPSHHHCVWSAETDLPPAPPTTTWQRCGCSARAAPTCTASPERVRRGTLSPRSTMLTVTSPRRVHGATPSRSTMLTVTSPDRVRRATPPPSSTTSVVTTPMSFQTFKPSPPGVESSTCPAITLRPDRCVDTEQTRAPTQTCHAMLLDVKHCRPAAENSVHCQQPTT